MDAVDETDSRPSRPGEGGAEGVSSMGGRSGFERFLDLMFWDIRVCEKGDSFGGGVER